MEAGRGDEFHRSYVLPEQSHVLLIEGSIIDDDDPATTESAVKGFYSQEVHENVTVPEHADNDGIIAGGFQWWRTKNISDQKIKLCLVIFFDEFF